MRFHLGDALTLAGRLTDQPGFDSGRERFRRFLSAWDGEVDDLRSLVDDARRAGDEQAQRALMDLVVLLGRHLGFAVTHGTYDRSAGAVRFDGAWRSAGVIRIVVEVRTARSRPFIPTDLARTFKALERTVTAAAAEEELGLCVDVPPASGPRPGRRRDEAQHETQDDAGRGFPLDALLRMAARVEAQSLSHEEVIDLLRAGAADPRVETLMAEPVRAGGAAPSRAPVITLVPREPQPDYWIGTIVPEGGATAAQMIRSVIGGRQLLGVGAIGLMPSQARKGDWVCFYVPGTGILGHARLGVRSDDTAQLRGASRFAAVFALEDVQFYPRPNALDMTSPSQRLATRTPPEADGPFLSQVSAQEFRALTTTLEARFNA